MQQPLEKVDRDVQMLIGKGQDRQRALEPVGGACHIAATVEIVDQRVEFVQPRGHEGMDAALERLQHVRHRPATGDMQPTTRCLQHRRVFRAGGRRLDLEAAEGFHRLEQIADQVERQPAAAEIPILQHDQGRAKLGNAQHRAAVRCGAGERNLQEQVGAARGQDVPRHAQPLFVIVRARPADHRHTPGAGFHHRFHHQAALAFRQLVDLGSHRRHEETRDACINGDLHMPPQRNQIDRVLRREGRIQHRDDAKEWVEFLAHAARPLRLICDPAPGAPARQRPTSPARPS
jgi:hypothetical protein